MSSDKTTGADNQQGSRRLVSTHDLLTPQRLHAELLNTGNGAASGLQAYLQGALRDGTYSVSHKTHRFSQSEPDWLANLQTAFRILGFGSWIYREGASRCVWVLETSAPFLSTSFDASPLVGTREGLMYVRGYFDADGGMPKKADARLYFQFSQKERGSLEVVKEILLSVDPNYWRFFVNTRSHSLFMHNVGSWHPRKRRQMMLRMKI